MKRVNCSAELVITGYKFDKRGQLVPSRIDWQGRTLRVQASEMSGLVSFFASGRYHWLERRGRQWQLLGR